MLREKRKEKNMTQVELAQAVGVSQSQIARYESGERTPKPATAKRIGTELGIDWTEFYKEETHGEAETAATQS